MGLDRYDFIMSLLFECSSNNERILRTVVTSILKDTFCKVYVHRDNPYFSSDVVFVMGYDFYMDLMKNSNIHYLISFNIQSMENGKHPDLFGVPVIIDDNDPMVKRALDELENNPSEVYERYCAE